MSAKPINTRLTIISVFAFLLIVALFMQPGGTAEQATDQLSEVARKVAVKEGQPQPHPTPVVPAPPRAWYAADPATGPVVSPPPVGNSQPEPPAGFPPMVAPDPPPQGDDFPENR